MDLHEMYIQRQGRKTDKADRGLCTGKGLFKIFIRVRNSLTHPDNLMLLQDVEDNVLIEWVMYR